MALGRMSVVMGILEVASVRSKRREWSGADKLKAFFRPTIGGGKNLPCGFF